MTCTECGTKCVKTGPGEYECPGCANLFQKPAKETKQVADDKAMNTGTKETMPRHYWKHDVTVSSIRAGADAEIVAQCDEMITRWYLAGEAVWMAAESLTFVAKRRVIEAKADHDGMAILRAAARRGSR